MKMKARGRFVENEQDMPMPLAFTQEGSQLHPLRLTTRKGIRRLSKLHIAQPDIAQGSDGIDN